ncbi:ABC transporter ATP-binding protein [Luteimonas salinilitoris]|uniref:ABC transporter ATP-binding protein n=1 Tax=Luteimonas salinilitoris TaxID=3237697 RepID=A0ABV4HTV2_9GAMM
MTAYIRARGVCLEVPYYLQPEQRNTSWLRTLLGAVTSVPKRHFATLLDDVSFEMEEGDRVALIGRNGAGKTTLLRVLTGAFQPTRGHVEMSGTKQALLNLGLGFNQEGTLIENIYLRATAMGIRAAQVRTMIDSILDFSELGDLANRRLFTLSSGQRMRLGFAISTSAQHDIMLLDEWFGAGDAQFVRKARERLVDRVEGSKIVVVASHNTELAKKLCNRGLVLQAGRVAYLGPIKDALVHYADIVRNANRAKTEALEDAGASLQSFPKDAGGASPPAEKTRVVSERNAGNRG